MNGVAFNSISVDGAEKQPFEAFIGKWEQSANTNADDYFKRWGQAAQNDHRGWEKEPDQAVRLRRKRR